ncbi:MAG: hypothetical protein HRT35_25600 [Algicola sp.]|nr:hypothetical protein [Algicola sp.]
MEKQKQPHDTKNRFDEIAITDEELRQMPASTDTLVDFFRTSPLSGVALDLDRDKSDSTEVQL